MSQALPGEDQVRIEFQQDQFWIDAAGHKHQLEDMSRAHLANVLNFMRSRADRLYAIDKGQEPDVAIAVDDGGFITSGEAWDWLESTPLILAIKARLA
jgi:plasmid stability protein